MMNLNPYESPEKAPQGTKNNTVGPHRKFFIGLLLPYVAGCLSSYWATAYLRPGEAYLFGTVLRDTLSFIITGPFFFLGIVLCIPWIHAKLQSKGLAVVISVVVLFSILQFIGVWGSMFAVCVITSPTFPP